MPRGRRLSARLVRGYVGAVVPEVYRELFAAIAATAGSLTGLLFVALSVTGRARAAGPSAIQQVRAAAALLAFTNAEERDTGLWASLSVLTGRTRGLDDGSDCTSCQAATVLTAALWPPGQRVRQRRPLSRTPENRSHAGQPSPPRFPMITKVSGRHSSHKPS